MDVPIEVIFMEMEKQKERKREEQRSQPRIELPKQDEKFITGDLPEDDEVIYLPL